MKIISKYKDYYDYLISSFGEDPKLILDRRKGCGIDKYKYNYDIVSLYICGKIYTGMYYCGKFYYGEDLLRFGERKINKYQNTTYIYIVPDDEFIEKKGFIKSYIQLSDKPQIDKSNYNIELNCPILLKVNNFGTTFVEFPKLSDYNFQSVCPPEEMFIMLSNWLSERLSEKENYVDIRGNVEKLESKGFDKKTSFRPNMK